MFSIIRSAFIRGIWNKNISNYDQRKIDSYLMTKLMQLLLQTVLQLLKDRSQTYQSIQYNHFGLFVAIWFGKCDTKSWEHKCCYNTHHMNDNWMAVTRMNDMYVCHLIPFRDHLWFHILVCSNHNWSSKFKTVQMHSRHLEY